MTRTFAYSLCLYFAFAWQATLRPVLEWHGYSPNFLVLALIGACVLLTDVSALIAAAVVGLLSDCLAQRGLGHDVLCYVTLSIALQALCPPKLVRNPAVLLAIVLSSTTLLEFAGVILRATLNHEITWNDPSSRTIAIQWGAIAFGNGIYTALLAVLPLVALRSMTTRIFKESNDGFDNRWHRLTSS